MSVEFKKPPINELVVGVYFDHEILSLRSEHIGLFWSEVKQNFHNVQQKLPVTPPSQRIPGAIVEIQMVPMPRFWFEASDGSTLMQIQRDAFLFNWRKGNTDYPHFEIVKAAFDKNKKRFFKFLSDELNEPEPKAAFAELNYVNVIESCDYWRGPQDTYKVIPRFSLPVPMSPEPLDFQQITSQRLAPDLTLDTTVRSARLVQDQSKPVLIIEYRATGLLPDADALDSWFDRAHDAISNCFTGMTDSDIQKIHWQRIDSADASQP